MALLRIKEDWKKALDDNKFIAAILVDLSQVFDCLPHCSAQFLQMIFWMSENSASVNDFFFYGANKTKYKVHLYFKLTQI